MWVNEQYLYGYAVLQVKTASPPSMTSIFSGPFVGMLAAETAVSNVVATMTHIVVATMTHIVIDPIIGIAEI